MEKPTLEIISMKIWEIEDIESGKNIPIRTGSINASADRYATFLVTFTNQYEPLLKVPFLLEDNGSARIGTPVDCTGKTCWHGDIIKINDINYEIDESKLSLRSEMERKLTEFHKFS
ncbi:hypothetical protein [Gimesia maris]|uniref:hypothetical protein n=1 Tax=Gimesia maris TaxID=122 RepID=UPI0030D97D68